MPKIFSNLIELHVAKIVKNKLSFLLLKRSADEWYPNIWQMVSGSINSRELAYKAAIRELKEETGLIPEKLFVVPRVNSIYLYESDKLILVPVFFAIVSDKAEVRISQEHSEYQWCSYQKAIKLLQWQGQKEVVKIIYNYWYNTKETFKFEEIKLKN